MAAKYGLLSGFYWDNQITLDCRVSFWNAWSPVKPKPSYYFNSANGKLFNFNITDLK